MTHKSFVMKQTTAINEARSTPGPAEYRYRLSAQIKKDGINVTTNDLEP